MATSLRFENPDIQDVADALAHFGHAVTQARLYGQEHRESRRAVEQFVDSLQRVLGKHGTLTFNSGIDGLSWRGTRVTVESDDQRGLGAHLHAEGIAALTITSSVTVDEILRVLGLLRLNLSLPEYEEETLSALLWQAQLVGVSFQGISALMDAEALSGREDAKVAETTEEALRRFLDLRVDQSSRELIDFEAYLHEDSVHAAMGRYGPRGLHDEDELEELTDPEQRQRNDEKLVQELDASFEQDMHEVERQREAIEAERPAETVARLVQLLLRMAIRGGSPLSTDQLLELAGGATAEIYARGDAVGILSILRDCRLLVGELAATSPAAVALVQRYATESLSPIRTARLLFALDPDSPVERGTLRELLRAIPEDALLAIPEWIWSDPDRQKYGRFLDAFVADAGGRLANLLHHYDQMSVEKLIPLLHVARLVPDPRLRTLRPTLLRYPVSAVRVAVLQWYVDDLPDSELPLILEAMQDRSSSVKRAAMDTLAVHRPPAVIRGILQRLTAPDFGKLDPARKTEMCVVAARICGESAAETLRALSKLRVPLFGGAEVTATVEAANAGLQILTQGKTRPTRIDPDAAKAGGRTGFFQAAGHRPTSGHRAITDRDHDE